MHRSGFALFRALANAALVALLGSGCGPAEPPLELPPAPSAEHLPASFAQARVAAEDALRDAPTEAARWPELARLYHANRFHSAAGALYAQVPLRAESSLAAEVAYLQADLAALQGDLEAAAGRLETVLELSPDYLPAYLAAGDIAAKRGLPDRATAFYEAALARDPDNPFAATALAREHMRRREWDPARQLLEEVLAREPGFFTADALYRQLRATLGEPLGSSPDAPDAAQGWYAAPEDPWKDALLARSFDPQQLSLAAEDAFRRGEDDRGEAHLARIERIAPESPLPWTLRATRHIENKAWAAAAQAHREALARGGDAAILYPDLVKTLVEMERYDEAEAAAREGLERAPLTPMLHVALSGLHLRREEIPAAVAELRRALEIDSDHLFAHRLLGRLLWDTGRREEAVAHFEQVREAAEDDLLVRASLAVYHLERGAPEAALPILAEARALQPADAELRRQTGIAYLLLAEEAIARQESTDALELLDRAATFAPGLPEIDSQRFAFLLAAGRPAEALAAIDRLLAQAPQNGRLLAARGFALQALGRSDEARQAFTRALGRLDASAEAALRARVEQLLAAP